VDERKKLLEQIRNNPNNVDYKDLIRLLDLSGFLLVSVKGDHYHYHRPGYRTLTVPCKNPLWIEIVKQALRLIDEIEDSQD